MSMKCPPPHLKDAAEKQLAESPASEVSSRSDKELLHELQVHQIELETQNEALRQAQIDLQKSHDRFVDFYELAPVSYLTITDKGLIADINLTGAALLGVERNKILQHRFSAFVIPEDADRYHSHLFGVLKTDETMTCELGLLRGDGVRVDVRLDSLRLIKDGQTPALRVVLTDITGRKQLEFELANRERHFAALIATTPVGVFETDANGKCVFVNERWQQIAGMSLDAAKGDGWTNAIHPEDRPLVYAEWAASTVERRPFRLEYRFQRTNSEVTWVLGQSSRFLSATGELAGHVGTITDITERRQIQESLYEHWARFKVMFDESPFGIALIDSLTGHIYAVNAMFAKIVGRTLEEMTTIDWMSITHPDDVQDDLANMELMNAGKTTGFQMNKRYIRPDGTFVWISMTIAPVYVKDKAHPQHLCMIEDITERKHAEDELRHKQAMLARTENSTHIGSWEWDVATDTVTWSDELFHIFLRNPADGAPSFAEHAELYFPEDMLRLRGAVEAALSQGTPYEMELRAIRQDGETRVCLARGYVETGLDQSVTRLFGSLQDITERKQAEEALRESELRFSLFMENLPACAYIKDAQGRHIFVNAALADQAMATAGSLLGKANGDLWPKDIAAKLDSADAAVITSRSPLTIEEDVLMKDEVRTYRTTKFPIERSNGEIFLAGISFDITASKQAEAEILRSNAELEQFSYAISHDMRQPLRMIAGYMQLLEEGLTGKLDGEQREYFGFAIDGAKRMDAMMLGLLEYSRVGRKGEPPVWIESRTLLGEALLYLQPAIVEAQVNVRIEGEWPRVLVCRDEMLRLIQNLIANAIKFRVVGRAPEVTVTSETVGKQWRISVADNGVGILPDQIGRLFQVFQRLQSRADYEGNGIGLALCRKIAEHHHGCIWAESAGEGQGSRFCFELPQDATEI